MPYTNLHRVNSENKKEDQLKGKKVRYTVEKKIETAFMVGFMVGFVRLISPKLKKGRLECSFKVCPGIGLCFF